MIQADGLAQILEGGWICVSDGATKDEATIDSIDAGDGVLTVRATFGEEQANFEWRTREVFTADGVVIDREEEDGGRKAPGAVWAVEIVIGLEAA